MYSAGGEVIAILFADECISIIVSNLPDKLDELAFRLLLTKKYGAIRVMEVWESEGDRGSVRDCNKIAKVTFQEKASAAKALASLAADYKTSLLTVRPGGITIAHQDTGISGHLEMSWFIDAKDARMDQDCLSVAVSELLQLVPLSYKNPEIESFFFPASKKYVGVGGERLKARLIRVRLVWA